MEPPDRSDMQQSAVHGAIGRCGLPLEISIGPTSEGYLDKCYSVDAFSTNLAASLDDPVAAARDAVAGADEVSM